MVVAIAPSRLAAAAAVALPFVARGSSGEAAVLSVVSGAPSSSDGGRPGEGWSRRGAAEIFADSAASAAAATFAPGNFSEPASPCGLCPVRGSALRTGDAIPYSLHTRGGSFPAISNEYTCEEWDALARGRLEDGSADCLDARDALMHQCCDGMSPVYRCSQDLQEMLGILSAPDYLDSNNNGDGGGGRKEPRRYRKTIPPVDEHDVIRVHVVMDATSIEIVDHGVGGGAVEASGTLTMSWTDDRLVWNASEAGCTSFRAVDTDIWMPGGLVPLKGHHKRPMVMADGRVSWSREGTVIADCETMENAAKKCDVTYTEMGEGYQFVITTDESGNTDDSVMKGILGEEYVWNQDLSGLVHVTGGDSSDDVASLIGRLYFDPKGKSCNICGYGLAVLQPNATLPQLPEAWKKQFGGDASNCADADAMLAKFAITEQYICSKGRAALEETCCDDVTSAFECESNIHDTLAGDLNTISPPDPSPQEGDITFSSTEHVDVKLNLDLLHIFGIDMKSSTMTLLVALDLNWYDDRLSWDPFIGGCHRISYRASTDAELTEIWVPELVLINQVEGLETLSDAHASVRYTGHVKWRRTGVLHVSCAMKGLETFPFDVPGCYLEFGATRDPLYHHIKYVASPVEYSERVEHSIGFQEYWLEEDRTEVTTSLDEMSGFSNEVIRFQFYFSRATSYYVTAFILLYIFFTFMSFGMFFIDYQLGERLGFGSSILFVIVAQDITMSDKTPVTDQMLWIYRLSFGSKIFVILALVQSLIMLYTYSHGDYETEGRTKQTTNEETRPLVTESGNIEETSLVDEEASADEEDTCIDTDQENPSDSFGKNTSSLPQSRADTRDDDGHDIRMNPCRSVLSRVCRCFAFIGRNDFVINEEDSEATVKLKTLRRLDWFSAIAFFLSYTIFLLVVFLYVWCS